MEERDTCNEMEAEERGGLIIPGLPVELVLAHVLPMLPWYTRPVCRAISKVWKACVDTSKKRTDLKLKTREYQLPLLKGLFLICTFDTQIFITRDSSVSHEKPQPQAAYKAIQWRSDIYQIHRQWRKLPPLQGLLPRPPTQAMLVASSGMVYVWSDEEPNFVLKMDMGCGDWTWNKFSVSHHFNVNAVDFNGKIYVPGVSTGGAASLEEEVVLMYDMMTDQCEQVRTWNRDNLRVLPKKSSTHSSLHGEEELYSFVEDESSSDAKLELLVYDACRDSWRTQEEIPIPEYRWSELPQLKLLNGDCFEPALEMGTNTVWIDSEGDIISWFNSSLHKNWVGIDYNPFLKGRCLEYMQLIRGSLYGIFCEDKADQDDEEDKESQEEGVDEGGRQDRRLFKRTIMKGRICVANRIVSWEEVHEVGCFDETYYIIPSVVSPIDHYTLMA